MGGRGRGRGRGRGAVPPSVASAPFGSQNGGSPSISASGIKAEPSQKFPDILIPEAPNFDNFTEIQLKSTEYSDKIDLLLKRSAWYRPMKTTQQKIDRYSDKYLSHVSPNGGSEPKERLSSTSIQCNLDFFPEELHSVYHQYDQSNTLKRKKSSVTSTVVSFSDTLNRLESLAQKEESTNEEEKGEEDDEDKDALEVEGIEDEEFEDETDYNFSYFDNGEDYGGGDYDEGNDEAIF